MPRSAAAWLTTFMLSSTISATSTLLISNVMRPASIFDMSRMSLITSSKIGATRIDVARIFLIFRVTERAEQRLLHDLGEADDGVQRRAQLVADIGEELGLGPVGRFGAVLLQRIFFRQIDELLLLVLKLAPR